MPTQRAAAIERLKVRIAGRDTPDDQVCTVGEAAAERVEREAPGAPQRIKDEAVIRYAGWMAQSDYGGIVEEAIGPKSVKYEVRHANAWRNSGAAGLLAPWKVRRAVAIG